MENIKYYNPTENIARDEEPRHQVDLEIDGEVIGSAEITYYSKPIPLYQISELYIEAKYQSRGYAGKILKFIEDMLKKKRKPGVLVDAIIDGSPAQGMYKRRGWVEIPDSNGLFVFNLPLKINPSIFKGYDMRSTDIMERPGWNR